ncbi:MAG: hypothetical protein PHY42_00850 [Bacilli bacterium]|nr:hypothetical protein [Bacilli bacterium]
MIQEEKKEYQKPVIQVVKFTLEEGIAESTMSGEGPNLICLDA